jgi:hypothetical protein
VLCAVRTPKSGSYEKLAAVVINERLHGIVGRL